MPNAAKVTGTPLTAITAGGISVWKSEPLMVRSSTTFVLVSVPPPGAIKICAVEPAPRTAKLSPQRRFA